ncbi:cupin domain-containing protein [Streptomyces sp. NPDC091217]|uniref:cupin domain-containing protein n=1 Tax=Streptomyces sp. NPDC091217 TaxID=3365975 RepID=UPI00381485E2
MTLEIGKEPLDLESVDTAEVAFDEFCGALDARNMKGLWTRPELPHEPIARTLPYHWSWETVAPLVKRAGRVLDLDGDVGQRRALQFCNPGLQAGTTEALFGAFQYLEAGETAPAHRHTPAAIRFVLAGSSMFTTVNGDACEMRPGDLVLTPAWTWHDHTNYGDQSVIWLDVIDVPLVATLESVFFEDHPRGMQEVLGHNISERRFAAPGLHDTAPHPGDSGTAASPLLRYPYEQADRMLDALHETHGGPSVTFEYRNPVTGGPAVPTVTCEMIRVHPEGPTTPWRRAGGQIYSVLRGRGRSIIGGTEFHWGPGDVFVVPSWVAVEHEAAEEADIFIGSSRATLEALHLYREEQLTAQQEVVGQFQPLSRNTDA